MLDLEPIKAREAAATIGPWHWDEPSGSEWATGEESLRGPVPDGDKYPATILYGWGYDASGIHGEPHDREFIAHAREDVPALIREVERLRAEVARLSPDSGVEVE